MGPIVLALHLLGLGFWMFRVFHCFSIINRPSSFIVTQFRGMQPPHIFSEISYHRPISFMSILSINIFQSFDINETNFYFYYISVFMLNLYSIVFSLKSKSVVSEKYTLYLILFSFPYRGQGIRSQGSSWLNLCKINLANLDDLP